MTHLEKLKAALGGSNPDAIIVTSEVNQRYISCFPFTDGYLLVTKGQSYLVTDFRYTEAAKAQADGGLEVEWTGREGRTTMYSFAVRVEDGGTLAISDGRETVALVTAADGEKIVSVANRQEKAVFRFEFEPGAGENPGKAVLGPFSRMGCGFSVLVR